MPPLHLSTTYVRDPDNQYRTGYVYGRPDNATVRQTEAVIAALEGAQRGDAVRLRHGGGDQRRARACRRARTSWRRRSCYWGFRDWLKNEAPLFGYRVDFVDMSRTSTPCAPR